MAPRLAFKVLCPEPLASSIIGTKGSTKDRIQEECGCRLVMSNRDEFYPQTRLRLVVIHGDDHESILKAIDRILELLSECADGERESPGGRRAVEGEADFLGKEPNELVMRLAVPVKVGSAIIGPKGAHVQQLKEECSAKVIIDNEHRAGHQACRVAAGYEGLRMVAQRIMERLEEELRARPPDFEAWANIRSFGWEESQGGKGGHGRPRSRSRDRGHAVYPSPHAGGGMDVLHEAMGQLGEAVDFEYEITCNFPPEKVSAMIGPGGQIVNTVRQSTNTAIHFDNPGAREQSMRIRGPLLGVYRAHVMMMRRYHEHDVESQHSKGLPPKGKGEVLTKGRHFDASKGDKGKSWTSEPRKGSYDSKGYDKGSNSKGGYDSKGAAPKGGKSDGFRSYGAWNEKSQPKGAPYSKGKGKDGGWNRDSGAGKGGAESKGAGGRSIESSEQLEGMLANLERQLKEVKGKLGRT